jgi:hypothetical protein
MNTNCTVSCRSIAAGRRTKGRALYLGLCALAMAVAASASPIVTFDAPGAGTGSGQGTGSPGTSVGLNVFGATAGYYIDANYVVHGYLRYPTGEYATFLPPGVGPQGTNCYNDCPIGLNDWGSITGIYLDANNVYHGFLRTSEGEFTTFEAPGADTKAGDGKGTFPYGINDQGVITGYYIDANNVSHGFLRLP